MQLFEILETWRKERQQLPLNKTLGFVPTMGNLHEGHCQLIERSQRENDYTVVSLFVNPTQFDRQEDFVNYPRTIEADLIVLKQQKIDYCLIPSIEVIYADDYRYQVHEMALSQEMEAKHRPGHFTGVLTVLIKLFNLVKPHRVYFGEKDYQQYCLVRDMVKAFFLDMEVVPFPVVREQSGLACSSRNNRLNAEQRLKAETFARIFHQKNKSKAELLEELDAHQIVVEYLEEYQSRRFIAINVDDIRLIDNYPL
ncbi:MAG: pantoate--beta-alanine ligase [Legionella sp.]|nr:pantoate--beta-alanine ligase [Legionella sp.]